MLGTIAKALKTDLTADDKQRLTDFMATLSKETSAQ
jgi:hypothetical protein